MRDGNQRGHIGPAAMADREATSFGAEVGHGAKVQLFEFDVRVEPIGKRGDEPLACCVFRQRRNGNGRDGEHDDNGYQ